MKTLLTLTTISLSLFLFVGFASASTTDLLQPASDITYNENLIVNGYGDFDSIRIGEEGIGGVTYFNGTIVNVGETVPVTFGDDVRIDGQIWGGPNKGNTEDQALKIADTLMPALTNANDLGSDSLRWRDLYLAGNLDAINGNFSNSLKLNGKNVALELHNHDGIYSPVEHNHDTTYLKLTGGQINGSLNITGTFAAPGGISTNSLNAGGITAGIINTSGVISNGNLTATGNIYVAGDVDGINVSQENAVWYSTALNSTSVVTVPGSNPGKSMIFVGGASNFPYCDSAGKLVSADVNLPSSYNSISSYTITASEEALAAREFKEVWVERKTNSQIRVSGECIANTGNAGKVLWTTVGY